MEGVVNAQARKEKGKAGTGPVYAREEMAEKQAPEDLEEQHGAGGRGVSKATWNMS